MTNKKDSSTPHGTSAQTADMLSKKQTAKEKSEQQHYSMQDKGKTARIVHTNGSTPKSRL